MKKFMIAICLSFMLMFAGNAMATCPGGDCYTPQAGAIVQPNSTIAGDVVIAPVNNQWGSEWAGGAATANATLSGYGEAKAKDSFKRVKVYDKPVWHEGYYKRFFCWKRWVPGYYTYPYHYEYQKVAGVAEAYGETELTMSSKVKVLTNGPQYNAGLSYTFVSATSKLDVDGVVWAKGTKGCLQEASLNLNGNLSAMAMGNSYVEGHNSSFAQAYGEGMTTVYFQGHEYDSSTWDKAFVDFNSDIKVNQKLFATSYVSPDGTTSANFAKVWGGSAELYLGRDGWCDKDNIDLTGISAKGRVNQSGMATNGAGSYAYGGSSAYFKGAVGSVNPGRAWCGPDQVANVGGYAVVAGYNNVSSSNGSLTVTSKQWAKATTGNSGQVPN